MTCRRKIATLCRSTKISASFAASLRADGGEEDLRELWETEENQRLTGAQFWVEVLTGKGPLRAGLRHSDAVDMMWLLMPPASYYRLAQRRRWKRQKYQRWLAASISQLLFAGNP